MSYEITEVHALEVLDSRARPTLEVSVRLSSGAMASAGVPSGASTGTREAVELRDGDPERFNGAGVTKAASNVNGEVNRLLAGRQWPSLAEVDRALVELDGTANKSRWGANAIVGTSMAAAGPWPWPTASPCTAGWLPRVPSSACLSPTSTW